MSKSIKLAKVLKSMNFEPTVGTTVIDALPNSLDYMNYSRMDENREQKMPHIKRLIDSYKIWGTAACRLIVVETFSISGKKEQFVIDGEHTRVAHNMLGLPLNVIIIKLGVDTRENLIKYMAILNNSNKAWTPDNFLVSYAKLNIREYKILQQIRKDTKLTVTDLQLIFLGRGNEDNFKQGNITFKDENNSMELLEATLKIRMHVPQKSFTRRAFYEICENTNDYDKFANAILKHAKMLRMVNKSFSENQNEFKIELHQIYNKHIAKKK